MFEWRLWTLGRKTTEVKCHSHHITSRGHAMNTSLMLILILIIRLRFTGFLHCKVTIPLSVDATLLGKKSLCAAHAYVKGSYVPPPWGRNSFINYWHFFYTGDLPFLSHIFIYVFNYLFLLVWTRGYLLYTLGYTPVLCNLFCCSNYYKIGYWGLFYLAPVSPVHTLSFCLFELQAYLAYSLPKP